MWPDVSGGLSIIPALSTATVLPCAALVSGVTRPWLGLGAGAGASTQRDQSVQGNQGKAGEFLGTDRLEVFG